MRLCISLFILFHISSVFADDLHPSIIYQNNEYMIVGSKSFDVELIAKGEDQVNISKHLIAVRPGVKSTVPIVISRNGAHEIYHLIMYQQINTPFIAVQMVNKNEIESGHRVTFQIDSNVTINNLSNIEVEVNGQILLPDEQGYYRYNTFKRTDELSVSALLLNIKKLSYDTRFYHQLKADYGCNARIKDQYLYASCYSDSHQVKLEGFTLAGVNVGKFNRVYVGDEIMPDLRLYAFFDTRRLGYSFDLLPDGTVTVNQITE